MYASLGEARSKSVSSALLFAGGAPVSSAGLVKAHGGAAAVAAGP